jgi:hypothetical protein
MKRLKTQPVIATCHDYIYYAIAIDTDTPPYQTGGELYYEIFVARSKYARDNELIPLMELSKHNPYLKVNMDVYRQVIKEAS